MAKPTAEQIIQRLANANGIHPALMRRRIEQALQNILADTSQPHSYMLADLFPHGYPTVDEFVVALESDLYDALLPELPGWKWDGAGYRNTQALEEA